MLKKNNLQYIYLLLVLSLVLQTGCAYYNTFYNAKQFYHEAEKERKVREKTIVVELTEEEKAQRKKAGQSTNAADKPTTKEMQTYQQAIEKASKVLEFFPNSKYVDDALILLGKCFYYRQEYPKAQRKFIELQQLYSESKFIPEAELFLAKTYLGLEEFDQAENQFLSISRRNDFPKDIREEAKYELASLYFKQGDYERAAENFTSSSKEADDKLIRAMSVYKLGECEIRLENFSESADLFKRAAKMSPNEAFKSQAMFKYGESLSLMGEYEEAITTYSKLLSSEYDTKRIPKIKLALAENIEKSGDLEEAIKWYSNIIEEEPRTDASARSYYALGKIEEFINKDYKTARENYDLVRSEFQNSLIAPDAKVRSDNIRTLLELNDEIARLEGRYVESDSLGENGDGEQDSREQLDDAYIDLPDNGLWLNYVGRHRPPPASLLDLTEADMQRSAMSADLQKAVSDSTDSTGTGMRTVPAAMDSAAMAELEAKQEAEKKVKLAEKRLALAEILFFSFNKPDSAVSLYKTVIENQSDSSLTTRAMYSLGYLYSMELGDSARADTVLKGLLEFSPNSDQAAGARKLLGMETKKVEIDSAAIYYKMAETSCWKKNDPTQALEYYDYISNHFPDSEYAAKAEYARGWLYERVLFQPEQALEIYKNFVETYPETEYGKELEKRLTAVEKTIKAQEAREAAIADSIKKAEEAAMDSLNALNAADSLQSSAGSDSLNASGAADSLQSHVKIDSLGKNAVPDSAAKVLDDSTANKKDLQKALESSRGRQANPEQMLPTTQAKTVDSTATQPEQQTIETPADTVTNPAVP